MEVNQSLPPVIGPILQAIGKAEIGGVRIISIELDPKDFDYLKENLHLDDRNAIGGLLGEVSIKRGSNG